MSFRASPETPYTTAYKRSTLNNDLSTTWMDKGECRRYSTDVSSRKRLTKMFYGERNRTETLAAKRMCAKCEVKEECLQFAIDAPHDNGIWGGTTPRERFKIRRGQRTPDQYWAGVSTPSSSTS